MLVLFISVMSLASNEMFSFSLKLMMLSLILIVNSSLIFLITDTLMTSLLFDYLESSTLIYMNSFHMENSLTLSKVYNYPTYLITFLLMILNLLITLIAVVKITKLFYGPLRMMN